MTAADIADLLHGKRCGAGWMARCPAHDDRTPSLSIDMGRDGRVLLHCHAGCSYDAVVTALGLTAADLMPPRDAVPDIALTWESEICVPAIVYAGSLPDDGNVSDKALTWDSEIGPAPPPEPAPPPGSVVATYHYTDGAGRLLYDVIRYAPKSFKQRRPDGQDGWIWNLRGVERVLYRLPEVLKGVAAGETVYVVEGEKDAEALAKLGLCATCNSGGAGKWQPSYTAVLEGADVVILPDRDEPGRKHGELVAAALRGRAKVVRIVELPDRDGHSVKDVFDWIAAGGSRDELAALAEAATPAPEPATPSDGVLSGAAILASDPPPHRPVLNGLFDYGALVEIVGPSKTRKSFFVMQLALCLAAGRDFFWFEVPHPFSVLLADLELSEPDLRRRLWRMGHALGIGPADVGDRLRVLPLAGQGGLFPRIEAAAEGADIVIADPLFCLCEGGESIEDLRTPLRNLRRLAVDRAACIFVHHDAKGAAGDRDIRDRGSGSGITGRSVDARICLAPNTADPENAVALAFMCRSYVMPEPRALRFAYDAFKTCELPAEPERSIDRKARAGRTKLGDYRDAAVAIVDARGPMSPTLFKTYLRDELNLSKGNANDLTTTLAAPDGPLVRWTRSGFPPEHLIGTREQQQSSQSSQSSREDQEDREKQPVRSSRPPIEAGRPD